MSLQPTIKANHYMISAGHYLATEAGYKILEAGGNAFDAGVAAGIALGVVEILYLHCAILRIGFLPAPLF